MDFRPGSSSRVEKGFMLISSRNNLLQKKAALSNGPFGGGKKMLSRPEPECFHIPEKSLLDSVLFVMA